VNFKKPFVISTTMFTIGTIAHLLGEPDWHTIIVGGGLFWLCSFGIAFGICNRATREPFVVRGPTSCPSCDLLVHQNVKYMGQAIRCPSCHTTFICDGETNYRAYGSRRKVPL